MTALVRPLARSMVSAISRRITEAPGGGYDLSKLVGAANSLGIQTGMALSHSNIPNGTVENFIAANCNHIYHYTCEHWGSLFPTVGNLSATNKANLDEVAAFAAARGLHLRWHELYWHSNEPSDLATALSGDWNATVDTWMQYVADNYGSQIGMAGVGVLNEFVSDTALALRTTTLTSSKVDAITAIATLMERARLKFPTKRLAFTDYCTLQGTTFAPNGRATILDLLDDLEALDPALVPDIFNEQAHIRFYDDGAGGITYQFNQDAYARFLQELKDRGIVANYTEFDFGPFTGVTMTEGAITTASAEMTELVFTPWRELDAGDYFGSQGYVDDDALTNHRVFYEDDYTINARGVAARDTLLTRSIIGNHPSYPMLSAYTVLEPAGDVGTLSAINPSGASLTYSVQGTPTGGSLSITGGTTVHASGLNAGTNPTLTGTIRVTDGVQPYDWDPDLHPITVGAASNLYAPGTFNDNESWTRPASVAASGGAMVFTATPTGQQARRTPTAGSLTSGHSYKIEYDLVRTAGTFRMSLSGLVEGTNRSASGHYSDTLVATGSTTELWMRSVVSAFTGSVDNLVVTDVT